MADPVAIRVERAADKDAVFAVERAAFGQPDEARIVDAIRGTNDELASLVASLVGQDGGRIVGHVLYSRVRIAGASERFAAALGPVAVAPERQSQGIGGMLIRAGIERVRTRFETIFVLGNPRYYARFGFELAAPYGFTFAPGAERAFQMLQLAGARPAGGRVVYHPAFG
jgi:putative acetyltransferase